MKSVSRLLFAVVLPLLAWTAGAFAAPAATLELGQPATQARLKGLKAVTVDTKADPAYKGDGRFEGWRLEEVLALFPDYEKYRAGAWQVTFVAADGYAVTAPLKGLLTGEGVIAFRDLKAPAGQTWRSFTFGKSTITPAPFYLVWGGRPYVMAESASRPWPWQLVKIQVAPLEPTKSPAYPSHDASAVAGYNVFAANCLSCHSVNLEGGQVGPELNVPKSITEYWRREDFVAFVKNPANYRARSKMSAFTHLSDKDILALHDYLSRMSQKKLCSSAEACAKQK